MPINCAKCHKEMPAEEAMKCCCGDLFFCSKQHFDDDPHSRIEDDKHQQGNELIQCDINVKFSRFVGRGGYVDLMNQLTEAMLKYSSFQVSRQTLPGLFGKETSSKQKSTVITLVASAMDSWAKTNKDGFQAALIGLQRLWQNDSPRSKQQIEAGIAKFTQASLRYLDDTSNETSQINLKVAGAELGAALNGSRN